MRICELDVDHRAYRNYNRENMGLLSRIRSKIQSFTESIDQASQNEKSKKASEAENIQEIEKTRQTFEAVAGLNKDYSLAEIAVLQKRLLPRFKYLNFEGFLDMKVHQILNDHVAQPSLLSMFVTVEPVCVQGAIKCVSGRSLMRCSDFKNDLLRFFLQKIEAANQAKALLLSFGHNKASSFHGQVSSAHSNLLFIYPFEFLQRVLLSNSFDHLLYFLLLNLFDSDLANCFGFDTQQMELLETSLSCYEKVNAYVNPSSSSKPLKRTRRNKFALQAALLKSLIATIEKKGLRVG